MNCLVPNWYYSAGLNLEDTVASSLLDQPRARNDGPVFRYCPNLKSAYVSGTRINC